MITSTRRDILDCGIIVHPCEDKFEEIDCMTVNSTRIVHVEDRALGYGAGDTTREERCEELCRKGANRPPLT